jgi:predicted XRE-type DNA-binding protein
MKNREKILNQPSYWIEKVNASLYDSIVNYMERHNMKQKDLAEYLGLSKGRVSQILNDGEINFSLEKIIHIALKVDKYPSFSFEDKKSLIDREKKIYERNLFIQYNIESFTSIKNQEDRKEAKVISMNALVKEKITVNGFTNG